MAETFIGYKERFRKAWAPYWQKWRKRGVIRCKKGTYGDIPMETYAGYWSESQAPEPEELAEWLDRVLRVVLSGSGQRLPWYKPEGMSVIHNLPINIDENYPAYDNRTLIVRKPFECNIEYDFDTRDELLLFYGRFASMEKICQS